MKIAVAADHAGYELKEAVKHHLLEGGHEVRDFGASGPESSDYPDYGAPAARAVARGEVECGVLVCGSGIGMSMVANKVPGIRAALAWCTEVARLSRQHNDANVLCLPARFVAVGQALEIVDEWLASAFERGRHERRISKMMSMEKGG